MSGAIYFLVFLTLTFATLAQNGTLSKGLGYGVAGSSAALAMILAVLRYRDQTRRPPK